MSIPFKKYNFLVSLFIFNFYSVAYADFEMNQEVNLYLSKRNINQSNLSQHDSSPIYSQLGWVASNIRYSPEGQFNLELRPEIRYLRDKGISYTNNDPAHFKVKPFKRYLPLEWRLHEGNQTESYLSLEKAKISYQNNNFESYIGRKAVSLGTLRIFPVWNKFSKISPLSFAAPQIITTQDGGGVRYQLDNKMFQVVAVVDDNEEKNAYLSEFVLYSDTLETHLLVGRWWEANAAGLAFTKDFGGMNLKGEALYIPSGKNLDNKIIQAGFGSEYAFTETLSALFEYFYESNGNSEKKDYKLSLLDRFSFLQNKSYVFTQALWKASPTLNISQGFLININDKSSLILSKAEYSYSESMDLTMALSKPTGSSGSEFSKKTFIFPGNKSLGSPTILSLSMKVFF